MNYIDGCNHIRSASRIVETHPERTKMHVKLFDGKLHRLLGRPPHDGSRSRAARKQLNELRK